MYNRGAFDQIRNILIGFQQAMEIAMLDVKALVEGNGSFKGKPRKSVDIFLCSLLKPMIEIPGPSLSYASYIKQKCQARCLAPD
jgi:hypothetical protein